MTGAPGEGFPYPKQVSAPPLKHEGVWVFQCSWMNAEFCHQLTGVTIVEDLATYKELLVAGGRHGAAPEPDEAGQLHAASSAEAGPAAALQEATRSGSGDGFADAEHEDRDGPAPGLKPPGADTWSQRSACLYHMLQCLYICLRNKLCCHAEHSTSSFAGFGARGESGSSAKAATAPEGWAAFM